MTDILTQGTIIIGVLIALTNIITEVAKLNLSFLSDAQSINRFATITGIILTMIAGLGYCQINNIAITWIIIVSLIIGGVMVSLGSMLGFDKLIAYFEGVKGVE